MGNKNSLVTPLPGKTFFDGLSKAVAAAKTNIDVIQYQWNFYPGKPKDSLQKFNQILLTKIRSGVKCRALLNKEGRGQQLTAINMRASTYLKEAGAIVKFGRTFPITHAKLWLIDDDFTVVGSHNLSSRSFNMNIETSVVIINREICMEFRRYFNEIWRQI